MRRSTRRWSPRRPLGLLLALGLTTACGGGGGGGSSVDPNAPVLTNLRVQFAGRCTVASQPGSIEVLAFDYADADGNVRGGTVENTTSAAVGAPITVTLPIPSPGVTITGTTSGTITITACLRFGSNASVTERVRVTDASGRVSNELTLVVARPGGAPLLPRDGEAGPHKSLEFGP